MVNPDPMRGQVLGQRLGHPNEGGLGGVVHDVVWGQRPQKRISKKVIAGESNRKTGVRGCSMME